MTKAPGTSPEPPTMTIKKLWIEEGCISCSLCEEIAPEAFLVEDGLDCVIRPEASSWFATKDEEIRDAIEDCPVEVIKFEDN